MTDRERMYGFAIIASPVIGALVAILLAVTGVIHGPRHPDPTITLSRPDLIRLTCEARVFVRNPDGTTARIKITGCP